MNTGLNESFTSNHEKTSLVLPEGCEKLGSNVLRLTRIGRERGSNIDVDEILESLLRKNHELIVQNMVVVKMCGSTVDKMLLTYSYNEKS